MRFQVIVGNVGTVYDGEDFPEANDHFQKYVAQSKSGSGRAAGEGVVMMDGDFLRKEYTGFPSRRWP